MKKLANFLFVQVLVVIIFTTTAFAQKTSLLWEISGNGLKKPSYIYGTIHLIPKKDFVLKESVKTCFNKAEKLVMELDLSDSMLQMKLMQGMAMKDKTVDQVLTKEQYKKVDDFYTTKLGMSLNMFKTIKISYLAVLPLQMILAKKPMESYEKSFMSMANEKKLPIVGIETPEDQMGAFEKIPQDDQIKMLMEMVDEFKKSMAMYYNLVKIYKTNDLQKVYEEVKKSTTEYKKFDKVLIDDRNANWIPKIENLIKANKCFIAVGAAHLGGKLGVVKLLKKKGYTLKPIF